MSNQKHAPDYLRLVPGGARYRMMRLKDRVTAYNINRPPSTQWATWRDARKYGFHDWQSAYGHLDQGMNGNLRVWYTHTGEYFRDERFADEVNPSIHHTGWFTNHDGTTCKDGSGLARGIVARLSHGRFIAGYWWGDNDERVWFDEVYSDEVDAANAADSHAENWADVCREDSERFAEMQLAEFDVEEKTRQVQEAIALRHRAKFGGFARVRDSIVLLREAREELSRKTAAYEGN